MIFKLHLADECPPLSVYKYIDYVVRMENNDLCQKIDKELEESICKAIDECLGSTLWRELRGSQKVPRAFKFSIPCESDFVYKHLKENPKYELVQFIISRTHKTPKIYPFLAPNPNLKEKIDLEKISELLIKEADLKIQVAYRLIDDGVLISDCLGSFVLSQPGETWAQIKSRCPNILEWWIEDFLERNENRYNRVVIISEEEDLEDLKNALRS